MMPSEPEYEQNKEKKPEKTDPEPEPENNNSTDFFAFLREFSKTFFVQYMDPLRDLPAVPPAAGP